MFYPERFVTERKKIYMDITIQQTLEALKDGAQLVNRMNGHIYLELADHTMQRVSRAILSQLKQQGLIQRATSPENPFVRTYTLSDKVLIEV
jgi:hypothetical protein